MSIKLTILIAFLLSTAFSFAQSSDTVEFATIHIYRSKKFSGSAVKADIYMSNDDVSRQSVGKLKSGQALNVKLYKEGKTFFVAEGAPKKGAMINVEFGKDYYMRIKTQNIMGVIRVMLEFVDADTGREESSGLKSKE